MPVRRQSKCKELSNGLIIRKDMASSGAMMAQTFSFTIPQSPGMDIGLCKKGTQSNLRLSRGRKVPRRPMFRNPGVESPRNHSAGRERRSAGLFFLEVREVKQVKEVKEKPIGAHPGQCKQPATQAFSASLPPLPSFTSFTSRRW